MLAILDAQLRLIEAAHFCGDLDGRVRHVETFDAPHAAFPVLKRAPKASRPVPIGVTQPMPVITTRRACFIRLNIRERVPYYEKICFGKLFSITPRATQRVTAAMFFVYTMFGGMVTKLCERETITIGGGRNDQEKSSTEL
jgi:hypothetical protein